MSLVGIELGWEGQYSSTQTTKTFASENTIATILLQKNSEGFEQPIAFFSRALRDVELKYRILEKHAYVLVKALNHFRGYIFHSRVIAYVPNNIIKDILSQPDNNSKRGKLIVKIQEYDLEIKPTKLIRCQGLAKLLA